MLVLLLACAARPAPAPPASAPTAPTAFAEAAAGPLLALSGWFSDSVLLYDLDRLELRATLTDVAGAQTLRPGPGGRSLLCAEGDGAVLLVDPADDFARSPFLDDLHSPTAALLGPDGRIYVADFEEDAVFRYEADGQPLGAFVTPGLGGLDGPDIGMIFGPDGDLYVPGWNSGAIHRYDGRTGADRGLVAGPADGLSRPRGLVFDEAGALYATDEGENRLLRLDPAGPVELLRLPGATGLARDGDRLLIGSGQSDRLRAYDLRTDADLGLLLIPDGLDGLTAVSVL